MKLNFSISELTKTNKSIENIPNIIQIDNLLNLIFYCLQPLREKLDKPIIITSGFRSLALNRLVGGAANSQHCLGCAADFHIKGMKIDEIIDFIQKSDIEFDQLINEYDKWVHISFVKGKNRHQVFKIK